MRHLRIIVVVLSAGVVFGIWSQLPVADAMQLSTPASNGRPIANPWTDSAGALRDIQLLAQTTEPVAGPLAATATLDSGVPQVLSSGVDLQNAYARYSFAVPATPSWTMGFTIGDDGQGNYLDISLLDDAGALSVNTGFVRDGRYFLAWSDPVTDASIFDLTPNAVNTLSIAVYGGVITLVANDTGILDGISAPLTIPGDIRAKVAWTAGAGSAASPVTVSISDFTVWDIPRGGIVWGIAPGPGATPEVTPVQTPGSFVPSAAGA